MQKGFKFLNDAAPQKKFSDTPGISQRSSGLKIVSQNNFTITLKPAAYQM